MRTCLGQVALVYLFSGLVPVWIHAQSQTQTLGPFPCGNNDPGSSTQTFTVDNTQIIGQQTAHVSYTYQSSCPTVAAYSHPEYLQSEFPATGHSAIVSSDGLVAAHASGVSATPLDPVGVVYRRYTGE
jgi:hypothetical protein